MDGSNSSNDSERPSGAEIKVAQIDSSSPDTVVKSKKSLNSSNQELSTSGLDVSLTKSTLINL